MGLKPEQGEQEKERLAHQQLLKLLLMPTGRWPALGSFVFSHLARELLASLDKSFSIRALPLTV